MPTLNDHSETVTESIRVRVQPRYLSEHSDPESHRFVFGYRITIENEGDETVQLLTRHWVIIDANGACEEVRGEGVVGQTPVLRPGAGFRYESYCPLPTPWGTMEGSYRMKHEDGGSFDVRIGRFVLSRSPEK